MLNDHASSCDSPAPQLELGRSASLLIPAARLFLHGMQLHTKCPVMNWWVCCICWSAFSGCHMLIASCSACARIFSFE